MAIISDINVISSTITRGKAHSAIVTTTAAVMTTLMMKLIIASQTLAGAQATPGTFDSRPQKTQEMYVKFRANITEAKS